MQNKYLYKIQTQKEEQTEHTMTTTPWTIIQFMESEKKEGKKPTTARKVEIPKTTNCTKCTQAHY